MRRAEGYTPRRDVLDEADIIDIVRLAVEAALARKVGDLAVEPRDVAEDAGVGQAKETEVGRQVEFDAPQDRKRVVEGKSVSVRVDLGGRRIMNRKTILQKRNGRISNNHTYNNKQK